MTHFKLDKVTLTGADDSIDPTDLVKLAERYEFSEWGILLIHPRQGLGRALGDGSRFPSFEWVRELLRVAPQSLNLCAHLCGPVYVNPLMEFGAFFAGDIKGIPITRFQRIQLNFHGEELFPTADHTLEVVDDLKLTGRKFIFQCDGVNDPWVKDWVDAGCGTPLFDTSGGAGLTPDQLKQEWPTAWPGVYCGYAGGLGPDNVVEQLEGPIAQAAGSERIWIDMETRVRSDRDHLFDLAKCEAVLKSVERFVTK